MKSIILKAKFNFFMLFVIFVRELPIKNVLHRYKTFFMGKLFYIIKIYDYTCYCDIFTTIATDNIMLEDK